MNIACVLTTHLPMKAELRRNPDLGGKPAIVVTSDGKEQLVLDRSKEAAGVVVGMPIQEAISRCKGATLIQADNVLYHTVFEGIIESLCNRSPLVEKGDLGCAFVGLDGLAAMYGGDARLTTSLMQAVPSDLNPRIGIAQGKFPAYVAALANEAGRARAVTGNEAEFLSGYPVEVLPLSWQDKRRLEMFGVHTLGELAALPIGPIQAQFGKGGVEAWTLSRGVDSRPFKPYRTVESVSEQVTLSTPANSINELIPALELLLARVFKSPVVASKYVRTADFVGIVLRGPPWVRHVAFKTPVGRAGATTVLRDVLERVTLPGPIEELGLTVSGITGESSNQSNMFVDVRRDENLAEMVKHLRARLGRPAPIYKIVEVKPCSRIPERRHALIPFDP